MASRIIEFFGYSPEDSSPAAVAALEDWDGTGEPTGWIREPNTGRRRPDATPTSEYVAR